MLRRSFAAALLLGSLGLTLAAPEAQAQKKGGKPIDSAKLGPGEYVGVVRSTPGDDRTFTIEVPSTQVVPALSGRRVSYRAKITKYEVEFQASRGAKVRTMVLPEQFDDKGNPKRYTAKQLAELKGKDRNLVGYESSLEKLEAGQVVRVVLKPAPVKPATKAKDKDKDVVDDGGKAEKKLQATLIVILKEGDGGSSAAAPRKKN